MLEIFLTLVAIAFVFSYFGENATTVREINAINKATVANVMDIEKLNGLFDEMEKIVNAANEAYNAGEYQKADDLTALAEQKQAEYAAIASKDRRVPGFY